MSNLAELIKQQEALSAQIKQAAKNEKGNALKEVRRLCKLHGFTHNQLKDFLGEGRKPRTPKQ